MRVSYESLEIALEQYKSQIIDDFKEALRNDELTINA